MTTSSVPLAWTFPLPRPYTGILLGNGVQGLMVWGTDCLSITVARTGFWDHREGVAFANQTNFSELRRLLDAGDDAGVKKAFSNPTHSMPYRAPTQLPGGRLDLHFVGNAKPERGQLDARTGILTIELSDGGRVVIRQDMLSELSWFTCSGTSLSRVDTIPAWHYLEKTLAPGGAQPPTVWADPHSGGFFQTLPEDPGLSVAWERRGDVFWIGTALGDSADEQVREALGSADATKLASRTEAWWQDYWKDIPTLQIPDAVLQRAWEYGLWKQGCFTPPHGIVATLQGPWMSETELPPWSNDYHFNINLQMIYWPAYPTHRLSHLMPVWDMIRGWLPALRENAAKFFGSPTALMLPHAVDDRGQVIGNFWQGTIDQACTAWMAQLAWQHYRHTLDETILREIAWPLLVGSFDGFWAMTEEIERNGIKRLSLPISVSAEFGGWGRDASFQLAAYQLMARVLPQAADVLGLPHDPRWARVQKDLPPYTTMKVAKVWGEKELRPRIVLWENNDLPESHRHHSHLASIYPFCTVDPLEETHRDVVRRSVEHWASMGSGQWVGWSMPWAAMLWARCNQASASVSILRIWDDIFTNVGHGTLHNADSSGYSGWIHGPLLDGPDARRTHDQMQMDAGMGVIQALAEILLQQRGDTLFVLPSLPKQWDAFSFDGFLTEGAFLVGATVAQRRVKEIRITSQKGGMLRLAHGLGNQVLVDGAATQGVVVEIPMRPGQTIVVRGESAQ